jgi:hypothetical protein
MSGPEPGWQPLALKCWKCAKNFRGWIPTGVQMLFAASALKATHCPACGADASHIGFDLENHPEPWIEEDGYPGSLVPPKRDAP